jgi:hypothetical protein
VTTVSASPERHPLRLAGLVTGGVVLVLAGAALILFVWLRSYTPLDALTGSGTYAPGSGLAAYVEPVTGSGGKPVFIPAYRPQRPFDTAFTLHNSGRFAVTVLGLGAEAQGGAPEAETLFATSSPTADPERVHAFEQFRLDRSDTATLVVRWRLDCTGTKAESYADSLLLRYRYLSMFTRTERIPLPFAVTLRCAQR